MQLFATKNFYIVQHNLIIPKSVPIIEHPNKAINYRDNYNMITIFSFSKYATIKTDPKII